VTTPDPTRDPGWGGVGGFFLMLVPVLGSKRSAGMDPLLVLRRLFGAFCTAIVLIFVALLFMDLNARGANLSEPAAVAITAIVGAVLLTASWTFARRALDCSALASSYRSRWFLQIAFAEAAALIGFVLAFVAGTIWTYPVGAIFTAIGFFLAAPTRAHLAQEQRRLHSAGCSGNLGAALRGLDR
jgi:hypothetical protein